MGGREVMQRCYLMEINVDSSLDNSFRRERDRSLTIHLSMSR